MLGARGQFVKGGISWLELITVEEWMPIGPVLPMPAIFGSFVLYPDGTLLVDVTATLSEWAPIPGFIEWRNISDGDTNGAPLKNVSGEVGEGDVHAIVCENRKISSQILGILAGRINSCVFAEGTLKYSTFLS